MNTIDLLLKMIEQNTANHRVLETRLTTMIENQTDIREGISTLKVKASIWGLIAGSLPVLTSLGIKYLINP